MHLVILGTIPSLRRGSEKERTCYMEPNPDQQEKIGCRSSCRRDACENHLQVDADQGDDWFSKPKPFDFCRVLSTTSFIDPVPQNPGNPLNSLTLANPCPSQVLSFHTVNGGRPLEVLHICGLRKIGMRQRSCWDNRIKHATVLPMQSHSISHVLFSLIQSLPNVWSRN